MALATTSQDPGVKPDGLAKAGPVVPVTLATKLVLRPTTAHPVPLVIKTMARVPMCLELGVWLDGGELVVLLVICATKHALPLSIVSALRRVTTPRERVLTFLGTGVKPVGLVKTPRDSTPAHSNVFVLLLALNAMPPLVLALAQLKSAKSSSAQQQKK